MHPLKIMFMALASEAQLIGSCTTKGRVRFLARAHIQVTGLIPSWGCLGDVGGQHIDVSLSYQCVCLPLPLFKNQYKY